MKYKIYILILLTLFISNIDVRAQNNKLATDSATIQKLIKSSFSNISRDPKQGLRDADEIIEISNRHGWKLNTAEGYRLKASNYHTLAEYDKAEDFFLQSLKISEQIADTNGMAKSYGNLGVVAMNLGDHPAALQYYLKALKLNESMKKNSSIARNLGNIGNLYLNEKDYKQALNYAQKGYNTYKSLNDSTGMAAQLVSLGSINLELKQFAISKKYFEEANQLFITLEDIKGQAIAYSNLSDVYSALKQVNTAYDNINKSIQINKQLGSESGLMASEISLARLLLNVANDSVLLSQWKTKSTREQLLNDAEMIVNRSLKSATDFGRQLDMESALILQADIRRAKGMVVDAQQSYEQALKIHDSIFSINNAKKIIGIESKREIELRDKQIEIQKLEAQQQKNAVLVLIAFLLLITIAGTILFRQNQIRKKQNKELDESNKVKARFFSILSHDLRAPIASLSNYIYLLNEEEDVMDSEMKKAHQNKIGTATNNLLSTMEDILLWSKSQMERFEPNKKNITVDALFGDVQKLIPTDINVEITFSNPEQIELHTDENYLKTIMRNLTANAIKALQHTEGAKIAWKAFAQNGINYLSITDNGPGLTTEQKEKLFDESAVISTKTGLGLHLVRDLCKMLQHKLGVTSEQGGGTVFTITVD